MGALIFVWSRLCRLRTHPAWCVARGGESRFGRIPHAVIRGPRHNDFQEINALSSYLAPTLIARANPEKGGMGIFAVEDIAAGDVLAVWAGDIVDYATLMQQPVERRRHSVQVEENLFQVLLPGREPEGADFVNHSCAPNAGINGQIVLVAMRPIAAGEEVCIDYAMCDTLPYDEFTCGCGVPECRVVVSGNDWMLPTLQEKYRGFFANHVQRLIDALPARVAVP